MPPPRGLTESVPRFWGVTYHIAGLGGITLRFPDGAELAGEPCLGEPVQTPIWGRAVAGRVVEGGWSQALSEFCGQQVRLVRSDESGRCYDEYPISVMSQATVDFLTSLTGGKPRHNVYPALRAQS